MKRFKSSMGILTLTATLLLGGCSKNNSSEPEPAPSGTTQVDDLLWKNDETNALQLGNGDQTYELKKNYTLKKGTYLMCGWIYVCDGATLTIEPGTVIKGDKETKASLICEPGGKIIADGTKEAPIVLTSNQPKGQRRPGDWGGLIICGRAKNNLTEMQIEGGPRTKHGGNDDEDNSGVYRYLRVEFAGYPFQTDQEINGITFGSVGRKTVVDHLQVSYSNDDSYEWFGGTVNCKYLVAYHGWDDEFDTDNGFSGEVQFLLGVRNPKIADQSNSNGYESDNNSAGDSKNPQTRAVFSNVTLVGPTVQNGFKNLPSYINGDGLLPNNNSRLGLFQAGMQIRRNSALNAFNTVVVGYPFGLMIESNNKANDAIQNFTGAAPVATLQKVYAGGYTIGLYGEKNDASTAFDMAGKYSDFATNNSVIDGGKMTFNSDNITIASGVFGLKQPNSKLANPNYGPTSSSPLIATGAANFQHPSIARCATFNKVSYAGAFASDAEADNWTLGWCNFDPQNTDY